MLVHLAITIGRVARAVWRKWITAVCSTRWIAAPTKEARCASKQACTTSERRERQPSDKLAKARRLVVAHLGVKLGALFIKLCLHLRVLRKDIRRLAG